MKACVTSRLSRGLSLCAVALALIAGCGGGGSVDVAGPGVGGTGAFASGPITGFGSIFVNGVRFDDSAARVLDDDGVQRGREGLALGMMVEVRGSAPVDADGVRSSTATEIRYGAELVGTVDAVDAAAGTLRVFGVLVKVKATTVIAGASGLAGVQVGSVVEVHGRRDDSGAVVASRIEVKAPSLAAHAAAGSSLRLTSRVTAVTAQGFSVEVGGSTVSVVATQPLPQNLGVGSTVKLRLQPTSSAGVYTAERVVVQSGGVPSGVEEAEVEGFVTGFSSAASFQVAGLPVTTSAATRYRHGTAADLKAGARVEVEGRVVDGVIAADLVDFKVRDDNDPGNDDRPGNGDGNGNGGGNGNGSGNGNGGDEAGPFEMIGRVGALDPAAGSFRLRGEQVRYTASTRFEGGSAADLANGVQVEVHAVLDQGGSGLLATRIVFKP